ncbi:class I SAM-dependent methyltransferase [Streptomyces bambusae]|uniref:Methyltransferase domain-containing protein n=1 Tax=Streptomyces bambusae TaxID=1550616 RepID=A0ABS6Z163_9ACTN|nr:class I SAM-dependent methyltransferase [Streptomyces bambusae]MBW5480500.1 methyltransferase domain-containing protein [Streptomyces bambusae]
MPPRHDLPSAKAASERGTAPHGNGSTDPADTDAGFTDAGHTHAGHTDAGYADAGYADAGYADAGYADRHAADYDRWFGKPGITGATVDTLAALAGPGPVLELGIGTGRVALPLAGRGLEVHGVDASEAMVRRLHAKPDGFRIPVTLGDFADVPVSGTYSLVYAAGGTFFELGDRKAKERCLASVAGHLAPGGAFVVDAHVPEALAVAAASGVPETVADCDDHLILCRRVIDASAQTYHSHYLVHEADRTRHFRVRFHYVSPGELDYMAERAGLRLMQRHGSWSREPYTRHSTYHVSVYTHR